LGEDERADRRSAALAASSSNEEVVPGAHRIKPFRVGIVVQSTHTLAGAGDLGKLIQAKSVVVLITENAVSVTITAQVIDDRKLRNRPGARP
jgi:hypothetical protein